ncbi:MAG: hypothetical protein PHW33_03500, partial [Candidatus Portnoybacteria bacterium]|nr:hypothetical protein [Candidatus Portnoybacteria bacterium]
GYISFGTNSADRLSINSSGNIGIGVANPYLYKMTVAGSIVPSTTNSYDLGASSYYWRKLYAKNVSSTAIDTLSYVSTSKLYISGSQFVPGNYFVQNGNAFSATGTLGLTDNNDLNFITNNATRMTILRGGNVGINNNNPTEALEISGNLKFDGSAEIKSTGSLSIGTDSTALTFHSSGPVSFSHDISVTGTVTSTKGFAVGSTTVVDDSGNISGDRVPEIVTARTTYSTLNDRLNGIVTNYSSVISNANMLTLNLASGVSHVDLVNTTAHYNNQIGTVQNDHSAWSYGIPTAGYTYGNAAYPMGRIIINGNLLYETDWSYGLHIFNLDLGTMVKELYTGSIPALPANYWNHQALDTVNNDWYVGSYNGYGLNKIDLDANTLTTYNTGNSGLLSNQTGAYYDNSMQYYNGKIYLFPYVNYMQVFDVNTHTFTNYGAASGLPYLVWHTQVVGNKLHISGEGGFCIWNMDTDTLERCYVAGGSPGLYNYTNSIYTSYQDPIDSDKVWISGANSFQEISKTTGYVTGTFHRIDSDTGLTSVRYTIFRIGDQIWLGSQYGSSPQGYLVFDLNAQNYFLLSSYGKQTGNNIYTAGYNFAPETYNGYYYFPLYGNWIAKSQIIYEASNVFQTNVLLTSAGANYTTAKFNYTGGVGTGNTLTWYISADNGVHWEGPVTANTLWEFANPGTQIKLKATMAAGTGTSPIIRDVNVIAYDGATWAGEGSNTVETEVLQARNSALYGVYGSVKLRLDDMDTMVAGKAETSHNHDERYLQLTGGTLSGPLIVNANVSTYNLRPVTNNLYDLGSATLAWKNLYVSSTSYLADVITNGTLRPRTTNAYDLGSSSYYWKKLFAKYASTTAIDALSYVSTTKIISGLGTNASPSYAFQGDPNTGMYWYNGDNIGFSGGGLAKLTVGSNGVVSFANNYPGSDNAYDLGTSSYYWRKLYAKNVSSTAVDALGYVSTSKLYIAGSQFVPGNYFVQNGNAFNATGTLGTTDAKNLTFITGGSSKMTILNSNGNVGIGTVNPASKLEVQGIAPRIRIASAENPSGYYTELQQNWDSNNPFNIFVKNKGNMFGVGS